MTINRLTLPEEFIDSARRRGAPRPRAAVPARRALEDGVQRRTPAQDGRARSHAGRMAGGAGAAFPEAQAFYNQLSDPILTDAMSVIPAQGLVGHTIRINRPGSPTRP